MSTSKSSHVVTTLYRHILRLANKFDANPSSKAFVYRHSVEPTNKSFSCLHYSHIVDDFLRSKNFYVPVENEMPMTELVRHHFHAPLGGAVEATPHTRSLSSSEERTIRIDTAFALMKKLSALWKCHSMFEHGREDEPRTSLPSIMSALSRDPNWN
jgi:hypothetical protein